LLQHLSEHLQALEQLILCTLSRQQAARSHYPDSFDNLDHAFIVTTITVDFHELIIATHQYSKGNIFSIVSHHKKSQEVANLHSQSSPHSSCDLQEQPTPSSASSRFFFIRKTSALLMKDINSTILK
jgi:hypothetical protein